MFEELLSILPYNPSLIHQLSFYGRRLRAEQAVRRIGLIFIVLTFVIQFFAVVSPAQPTAADSANYNDLVNGGFHSAAQAATDCSENIADYGTILANYGITCARVATAPTQSISSIDYSHQLYSMGRQPYNIAGETPVYIDGTQYFIRYLWGWDTGPPSSYEALNVTAPGGQVMYLLYGCGNLTSVGQPRPVTVTVPPKIAFSKTTSPHFPVAHSDVAPGTPLSFRVIYSNSGGTAQNVLVNDPIPAHTTYYRLGGGAQTNVYNPSTNTAQWGWTSMATGAYDYDDVEVKVDANTPNGTQVCNVATFTATGVAPITSNQVCMTVEQTAKPTPPAPTPPKPTQPKLCSIDTAILASSPQCVPCTYNATIIASNSKCKPCSASKNSQDTAACIVAYKSATNTTEGIADANNTTAQPNDIIVYTLSADNEGKAAAKNYVFQDQLGDVLVYSNIQNLYGGTLNGQDEVSWPAVTIPAGKIVTEQVAVKVMNTIPQNSASPSDPEQYDLTMTNMYGNTTINIHVPSSPTKAIETAAAVLPNTGPGSTIFVAAIFMVGAGYFFARSRLLAKEVNLVMQDSTTGGL